MGAVERGGEEIPNREGHGPIVRYRVAWEADDQDRGVSLGNLRPKLELTDLQTLIVGVFPLGAEPLSPIECFLILLLTPADMIFYRTQAGSCERWHHFGGQIGAIIFEVVQCLRGWTEKMREYRDKQKAQRRYKENAVYPGGGNHRAGESRGVRAAQTPKCVEQS